MHRPAALRLAGAALVALLGVSACSHDCPNCPGAADKVQVSPGVSSVIPAKSEQLVALVYDANGNLLSGHAATWESDDETIATVDADGNVSGVAVGDATITARAAGITGIGTVHVVTTSTLSAQVQPIVQSSCALAFCHVTPGPQPDADAARRAVRAAAARQLRSHRTVDSAGRAEQLTGVGLRGRRARRSAPTRSFPSSYSAGRRR